MVPFELIVCSGAGRLTVSGPVGRALQEEFSLCVWCARLALKRTGWRVGSLDAHLHTPLDYVSGGGPSCRFALAHAIVAACGASTLDEPRELILMGNVDLNGDVLPIGSFERKYDACTDEGFYKFLVSNKQPEQRLGVSQVGNLSEVIRGRLPMWPRKRQVCRFPRRHTSPILPEQAQSEKAQGGSGDRARFLQ
jgi:ATP-dependent Lon protease